MDIKQLFDDEQAVSPVIGVILMVAITVILAAVIGTFVLGLGDQVQSTTPNAQFQFDYDDTDSDGFEASGSADDEITVTHSGGDNVERSQMAVLVGGATAYDGSDDSAGSDFNAGSFATTISAGQKNTLEETSASAIQSDDEVRVVFNTDDGKSATLASGTVPN